MKKPELPPKADLPILNKKYILTTLLHMAQEFHFWSIDTLDKCKWIIEDIKASELEAHPPARSKNKRKAIKKAKRRK